MKETKYKLRKFEIVKTDIKEIKKYKGFLGKDNVISKNGHLFTMNELRELFSDEEINIIKNWKHHEYELVYVNEDYDKLISAIRNLKIKRYDDYVIRNIANSGATLYLYKNEDNIIRVGNDYKYTHLRTLYNISIKIGNTIIRDEAHSAIQAQLILIDRLRRHLDYDNPYLKD